VHVRECLKLVAVHLWPGAMGKHMQQ
jgi:hypothetical protein